MSHQLFRTASSLSLALVIAFSNVTLALADPPTNDDFDHATVVSWLPFTDTIDTSQATTAEDDPTSWCRYSSLYSVWYSFTPTTDMTIDANTFGSETDTVLSVYTGARGSLVQITCSDDTFGHGNQSRVIVDITANTTYYFLISNYYGPFSRSMTFSVQELLPPANDDFSNATEVTDIESTFTDTINALGATFGIDDPTACNNDTPTPSVWYMFTPATDMTIEANTFGSETDTVLAVYTGQRGELNQVACNDDSDGSQSRIRMLVTAGTNYYFMIKSWHGMLDFLTFSVLKYMPEQSPVAEFWFDPWDPYASENITFCDASYDPEEFGIASLEWDFGNGPYTNEACTDYQYTTDGDYTVILRVTTLDGRTAFALQGVRVRTHDVAITRILAPVAAMAGQTRPITVSVKNSHYNETVSIDLYKRGPDGDEFVGSSVQFVPVRPGKRTTVFTFRYTFTDNDAMAGEVTFYAIANIQDARDAFPENNEVTSSPPTMVVK